MFTTIDPIQILPLKKVENDHLTDIIVSPPQGNAVPPKTRTYGSA